MREVAFADEVLTTAELRDLTAAAKALGAPGYFSDLTPTEPASERQDAAGTRRCGHCREAGHYRTRCPQLA